MPDSGDARPRPSFHAGEDVHWIQAKLALSHPDRWVDATIADAAGTHVTLLVGGTELRYWCRDTPRLVKTLLHDDVTGVRLCERWHLLAVSIGPLEPVTPMVFRLEGGSAVEMPKRGPGSVQLFNLKAV